MIAKHVPMRSAQKSDFAGLVNYITDAQSKEHRLGNVRITNCETENLKAAMAEVLATQFGNTRASNDKTYHLLLSFRAGENPSANVLNQIEDRVCSGLGFSQHQRISAVHNDTDNLHIHIAINKIHPKRKTIHEPYKAYKALADICQSLEAEFGLERDNHDPKKTLSEGRANDMERHSGIESLVTWIKTECLEGIRSANSWQELHTYLSEHGLKLKEQGAGLVFECEDLRVKPSTVARDISKKSLEDRLGAFVPLDGQGSKQKKGYSKKPVKKRVNTTELYARYKDDQKRLAAERSAELKRMKLKKDRDIAAAKRSSKLRRAAIKVSDGRGINKKILYAQAHSSLKAAIGEINKSYKEGKDKLYKTHGQRTWADWLKKQAQQGDQVALDALRARESAQSLKGNVISTSAASPDIANLPIDNITKKGTIIYRAGRNAVRDDGAKLQVSRGANSDGVEAALKIAVEKYGSNLNINGSPEFKAQVIRIATKSKLPITFTDASLEKMRLEYVNKEQTNEQSIRRRSNSSSAGLNGSGAVANDNQRRPAGHSGGRGAGLHAGLRKPNIKSVGKNPPPRSQNRLRRLSELGVVHIASGSQMLLQGNVSRNVEQSGAKPVDRVRRDVSGSRPGINQGQIAAAKKYIAEREQKRLNGFDISKHYLYNAEGGSSASLTFAGIRKVDDHQLALLSDPDGAIGVYPVDKASAQRLSRVKIGEPVELTNKGTVKRITKGRSR